MKVLIAGCGDLGGLLGQLLAVDGHEVWGVRRQAEAVPASLRALSLDLNDPEIAKVLPRGFDAAVVTISPDGPDVEAYQRAYGLALVQLLEALRIGSPGLRRMILVTSTRVWSGAPDHPWVDESTPVDPGDPQGELLVAAEGLIADRLGPGKAVALRLGGIYGPGRSWILDRLREGTLTLVEPSPPVNRIHRDDAARALFELLFVDDPPPVVAGCDGQPLSRLELATALAGTLGIDLPEPSAAAPRSSKRVRPSALLELGFEFRYADAISGFQAVLEGERLGRALRE